jgi:hypothetical protein
MSTTNHQSNDEFLSDATKSMFKDMVKKAVTDMMREKELNPVEMEK